MNSHTPGPWYSVRDADGDSAIFHKRNHQDLLIAVTSGDDWINEEEDTANACLITAAPEMLNALEITLAFTKAYAAQHTHTPGCPFCKVIDEVEAVIRKVKGEL